MSRFRFTFYLARMSYHMVDVRVGRTESCRRQRSRDGLTLIDFLVVISIISLLMAISIPAVQQAREAMRRAECTNRLRQLALAVHGYEAAYKQLPMHGGGLRL